MVMRAGVPLLVLCGHSTHDILARNFVQTITPIRHFLATHTPPFIGRIYRPSPVEAVEEGRPGRVRLWLTQERWRAGRPK